MSMKKMIICLVIICLALGSLSACGKKESGSAGGAKSDNPCINAFETAFIEGLKKSNDLSQITSEIVDTTDAVDFSLAFMMVEEGYLNGFDGEVTGFKSGAMFGPVIGTIPFVGYIFETGDTKALVETLSNQANLNWNICTQADIKYVNALDESHVFFMMIPEDVKG